MLNTNYAPEIATANDFIINHNNDIDFMNFLQERKNNLANEMHSDRWSLVYDYLNEHYPDAAGAVVTGIAYWLEG